MFKIVRTQNFAFPIKKAFTLIELLVVIAIIGILATLAVVALQQARSSARDAKRIADIRQMQMALELYYYENGAYPTELEFQTGNSLISSSTGEIFMQRIPSAPSVVDGDCQSTSNTYIYIPSDDNSSYILEFCTGKQISNLPSGQLCANPGGIMPCDLIIDDELSDPFAGTSGIFVDTRDNQEYNWIKIENQIWMAENLRAKKFRNGDDIRILTSRTEWRSIPYLISDNFINNSACGSYNNEIEMEEAYGLLYSGHSVFDERGLCPEGWSIPTINNWTLLIDSISPDTGLSLHSCRKINSPFGVDCQTDIHPRWNSSSYYGDDKYNFSVYPGGWFLGGSSGNYASLGEIAYYWTSDYLESDTTYGRIYFITFAQNNDIGFVLHSTTYAFRNAGLNIRCIKD